MRHRPLAAAAALLVALAVPACGSDDEESSGGGGGSGSAKPSTLNITVGDQGKAATLDVPKSAKAGLVEITVENTGKRPHDAQLIRVDGNKTAADVNKVFEKEGGPIPEWMHGAGGVGTIAPGTTAKVTDILQPGTYFVFDTENDANAPLEVTGDAAGAKLPSTPATITANEYTFETSGLKAGTNRLTFDNAGAELHHVLAAPIAKGATFAEVKKFATSEQEPSGPPPIEFEKIVGTTVLDGGTSQVAELKLDKGKYAFLCFIQDRKGGPPHVAKGMIEEVTID